MTLEEALAFITGHGVVLESAQGPVPNIVEAIVGEPVRGSWWGHPKSHAIYGVIQAVRDHPEILVCRLVRGKVTYIHQSLWPPVARSASALDVQYTAAIQEEHTASSAHRVIETPFSDWIPNWVNDAAQILSRDEAINSVGLWILRQLQTSAASTISRCPRK